jgi:hypothetical protein
VWHLSERYAALEHLVDVVRFVVPHVLHLQMHVEMWKFRMAAGAVPLGRTKFFQTPGKMLAALEECRQRILAGRATIFSNSTSPSGS